MVFISLFANPYIFLKDAPYIKFCTVFMFDEGSSSVQLFIQLIPEFAWY